MVMYALRYASRFRRELTTTVFNPARHFQCSGCRPRDTWPVRQKALFYRVFSGSRAVRRVTYGYGAQWILLAIPPRTSLPGRSRRNCRSHRSTRTGRFLPGAMASLLSLRRSPFLSGLGANRIERVLGCGGFATVYLCLTKTCSVPSRSRFCLYVEVRSPQTGCLSFRPRRLLLYYGNWQLRRRDGFLAGRNRSLSVLWTPECRG
jgi:hypothetical protein